MTFFFTVVFLNSSKCFPWSLLLTQRKPGSQPRADSVSFSFLVLVVLVLLRRTTISSGQEKEQKDPIYFHQLWTWYSYLGKIFLAFILKKLQKLVKVMDRRDFNWRYIMWLNYIPSHTGVFGCHGELVSCRSCSGILSSKFAVIPQLLSRSHPSDVTPGGVTGSVLPRIIAGNSFARSVYLLSACYQDVDLTTYSLVKQRKNSRYKTVNIIILVYTRS